MTFTFQAADERPPHRDRLRCHNCRHWTRQWVAQGPLDEPDPDAVRRLLCDRCARIHRPVEVEG